MITISTKGFVTKNDVTKRIGNIVHRKNCIYSFYFKESEKMYIGQTDDFWRRMSGYRASIKSGILKEHQRNLYDAIDKYGYNFTITILCLEPDNLDDTETSYIEMFDTYKNGYNMTGGGKVLRGEKSPMYGKKHSYETRAKQSASRMGDPRPKSEEWCQEHSNKMKGSNNPNHGGLSEEHKLNVSIARRKMSVEMYAKKGINVTDENIQKVLGENNGNMRQTSIDIGCSVSLVRNFCIRHKINIIDNMKGEKNPKRIQSIREHAERGINISAENIKKVFEEQNSNIANTAKKIGCRWQVIKSFCDNNCLIQKSE